MSVFAGTDGLRWEQEFCGTWSSSPGGILPGHQLLCCCKATSHCRLRHCCPGVEETSTVSQLSNKVLYTVRVVLRWLFLSQRSIVITTFLLCAPMHSLLLLLTWLHIFFFFLCCMLEIDNVVSWSFTSCPSLSLLFCFQELFWTVAICAWKRNPLWGLGSISPLCSGKGWAVRC